MILAKTARFEVRRMRFDVRWLETQPVDNRDVAQTFVHDDLQIVMQFGLGADLGKSRLQQMSRGSDIANGNLDVNEQRPASLMAGSRIQITLRNRRREPIARAAETLGIER